MTYEIKINERSKKEIKILIKLKSIYKKKHQNTIRSQMPYRVANNFFSQTPIQYLIFHTNLLTVKY